ncbi:MAG: MMPL family transporter [Candidatus Eisenbacteria bacterium]|uniref:MMPL family transporter n=1 Tax=Eiseniibacteriota bacterium TaxID=2212470 RepID=A0A538UDQ3_UNCEI|nr:MAG: MMPL family transporter [Candidatus Eisenbacteria bacterium]
MLAHPAIVLVAWVVIAVLAGIVAARLPAVLRGGTDPIAGSPSEHVERELVRAFGEGAFYQYLLVLSSPDLSAGDPRFSVAARRLSGEVGRLAVVRSVETPWNSSRPELIGRSGHAALMVVTPNINAYLEAERFTAALRGAIAAARMPPEVTVEITGATAAVHAVDVASSADLVAAERIGLPITLVILLVVFGAPLAALLPILLAMVAVSVGFAGLYVLHAWTPVTVFAENVVSMIGLGVGVDYSLFVVNRFREERGRGRAPVEAAEAAVRTAGHSVLLSGATVAVGFLALFMVRASFLHTIALGGVFVVAAAVAASLTLLPALLVLAGPALHWPRRAVAAPASDPRRGRFWVSWAGVVMRRPWVALAFASVVLLVFVIPVTRLKSWNVGAAHLPAADEARRGYERLGKEFAYGWMSPIIVLIEAPAGRTLWDAASRPAVAALADRLARDPRSGAVIGLHQVLDVWDALQSTMGTEAAASADTAGPLARLPESLRGVARRVSSADGRVGMMVLMTPGPPEDPATMAYVRDLRSRRWAEPDAAGLSVQWGGFAAVLVDFDREIFGRLRWVVAGVVLTTFIVLAVVFRSLLIPLKATVLNTISVLAAYGFLVLLFQEGVGARLIGLHPPGGLNAFVVLMLFTILFGLSMDYEVFLLSRVREEYLISGDNTKAVALGLGNTAGIITSAALIMVSIFAAFGFTRLIPTREFGLGLAFAVALDATIIRGVLVPALMAVSGRWNWWLPGQRSTPRPPSGS